MVFKCKVWFRGAVLSHTAESHQKEDLLSSGIWPVLLYDDSSDVAVVCIPGSDSLKVCHDSAFEF